jgi:DNA-binding MarR family transcriptional regulator
MPSTPNVKATEAITDERVADAAAHLRMAIVRTSRRLRQEAAGETSGLTPTSVSALATVERHGPLTPSMTRTLGCLEREGLVERMPDPADGRSSLVSLNAAGRERLRRLRRRKNAYLARRLRQLPEEDLATIERAAAILDRMREGDAV